MALVGAGTQIIGRIARVTPDAILFEADVSLAVLPQQPANSIVLPDEGMDEIQKEKWNMGVSKKLKVFDQRDNQLVEGVDICALMPHGMQIVGVVTEAEEPRLASMRRGQQWTQGSITIKAYASMAVVNGRAACLALPPEDEKQDSRRDDAGIILLN